MTVFCYSIYDAGAKEYGPIFTAKNDNIAVRNYKQALSGIPDYVMKDYKLYCLFTMDTESGQLGLPFEKYVVSTDEKENVNVNN